jgi:hypothetical protein
MPRSLPLLILPDRPSMAEHFPMEIKHRKVTQRSSLHHNPQHRSLFDLASKSPTLKSNAPTPSSTAESQRRTQ